MAGFSLTNTNLRAAAAMVEGMRDAAASQRFRKMLVDSLEPAKDAVLRNIHSVTGRTARGVTVGPGRGFQPSAFLAIDPTIATRPSKKTGRNYPYPYAVEYGHGKVPPHPFFQTGVNSARSEVKANVEAGAAAILFPASSQIGGEFR